MIVDLGALSALAEAIDESVDTSPLSALGLLVIYQYLDDNGWTLVRKPTPGPEDDLAAFSLIPPMPTTVAADPDDEIPF